MCVFAKLYKWVQQAQMNPQEWAQGRQAGVEVSKGRLVLGYGMIGMIAIPKEYGRYMHQYIYIYIYNAHLLICLYVFAMLATSPSTI